MPHVEAVPVEMDVLQERQDRRGCPPYIHHLEEAAELLKAVAHFLTVELKLMRPTYHDRHCMTHTDGTQ